MKLHEGGGGNAESWRVSKLIMEKISFHKIARSNIVEKVNPL